MKCQSCNNYRFYQMMQQPYGYSGTIPCLTCEEWLKPQSNYSPKEPKSTELITEKVEISNKQVIKSTEPKSEKCECESPIFLPRGRDDKEINIGFCYRCLKPISKPKSAEELNKNV